MKVNFPLVLGIGAAGLIAYKLYNRSPAGPAGSTGITGTIEQVKAQNAELSYIPTGLVLAIIQTESSFDPKARGADGEYGLMQVHPVTWQWIVNKHGAYIQDYFDPYYNVLVGMWVLDDYYKIFGNWPDTVGAYNVGPGAYKNGVRNSGYQAKVLGLWAIA